jgi:hypothetical protein
MLEQKNGKINFTIWFKPTGWRENFEEKISVNKIKDNFKKYSAQHSNKLMYWSLFKLL